MQLDGAVCFGVCAPTPSPFSHFFLSPPTTHDHGEPPVDNSLRCTAPRQIAMVGPDTSPTHPLPIVPSPWGGARRRFAKMHYTPTNCHGAPDVSPPSASQIATVDPDTLSLLHLPPPPFAFISPTPSTHHHGEPRLTTHQAALHPNISPWWAPTHHPPFLHPLPSPSDTSLWGATIDDSLRCTKPVGPDTSSPLSPPPFASETSSWGSPVDDSLKGTAPEQIAMVGPDTSSPSTSRIATMGPDVYNGKSRCIEMVGPDI